MKKILSLLFIVFATICSAQIGPYPSPSLTFTTGVTKTGSVVKVDTTLISTKYFVTNSIGNKIPYTGALSDPNLNNKNLFNVRTFDSVYIGLGAGNFVSNLAIGKGALSSNTTGQGLIAIGNGALHSNTTGGAPSHTNTSNIAIGDSALFSCTTTEGNIAIGDSALYSFTGGGSVAIGRQALTKATTGAKNTAIGQQALNLNTTGQQNTAIGNQAFIRNRTGSDNIAIGYFALGSFGTNANPSKNTAVGSQTAYSCSSCASNVFVGYSAGASITTGSNNVYLQALSTNATSNITGSGNVYIGFDVGRTAANGTSNQLRIDNTNNANPLLFGDFSARTLIINGGLTAASGLTVTGGIISNPVQTTVSNSTSGTTVFSEPITGTTYKKVIVFLNAALGTASYTFPVAFTNTPSVFASDDVAAAVITAKSTTAITVTGATSTGFLILEGY